MSIRSSGSSPDPLSRSIDRLYPPSSPLKRMRDTPRPLRESSPNISRQSSPAKSRTGSPSKAGDAIPLECGDSVVITTPGKAQDGRSDQRASPLKIRLTVERDEDQDNYEVIERTTTISVPLKDEHEHRPVKRRVRRRSTGVTKADEGSRDNVSSSRRRASPQKALAIAEIEKEAQDTPAKKRRGRPRKSGITNTETNTSMDNAATTATAEPAPRRVTRMNFAMLTPLHLKQNKESEAQDTPVPYTPWELKATKSRKKIQERVPTPRKPPGWHESLASEPVSSSPIKSNGVPNSDGHVEGSSPDVVMDVGEYPFSDGGHGVEGGEVNHMTGMEDDTTMLDRSAVESEGFSMVSIDSLRNQARVANLRQNLLTPRHDEPAFGTTQPLKNQSTSLVNMHPRSPPPSSPLPEQQNGFADRATESLVQGDALTNANEQVPAEAFSSPGKRESGRKRKSDERVFNAFGAATKRQLRTGLAVGELLARNEVGSTRDVAAFDAVNRDGQSKTREEADRLRAPVSRAKLPTPEASVDDSGSTPVITTNPEDVGDTSSISHSRGRKTIPTEFSSSPPRVESYSASEQVRANQPSEVLSHTHILERQFQQERQEVIAQIQAANTSQVIVIDTDAPDQSDNRDKPDSDLENANHQELDNDVDEDMCYDPEPTADIWREEAERSLDTSLLPQLKQPDRFIRETESPAPNFADLFVQDLKPTRAKLPRTWRRVSGNDFHYSDEVESPVRPVAQPLESALQVEPQVMQQEPYLAMQPLASTKPVQSVPAQTTIPSPRRSPRRPPQKQVLGNVVKPVVHTTGSSTEGRTYIPVARPRRVNRDKQLDKGSSHEVTTDTQDKRLEHLPANDVRPLTRELRALARPGLLLREPRDTSEEDLEARQITQGMPHLKLATKPEKQYQRLFDQPSEQPRPIALASNPVLGTPSPLPEAQKLEAQEAAHSRAASNRLTPSMTTNVLGRVVSWLLPITTTNSTQTPDAATTPAPQQVEMSPTYSRIWTRNHYLLLDHYYKASNRLHIAETIPRRRGPALHSSYHIPFNKLPSSVTRFLHKTLTTEHPSSDPAGIVTEQWIRVAHAFIEEARGRGIPILCDPKTPILFEAEDKHIGTQIQSKPTAAETKYPLRGPDGHVVRTREDWRADNGEWEVVRHLYSLWVRDSLRAGRLRHGAGAASNKGQDDVVVRDEVLVRETEHRTKEWVRRAS